MRFTVATERKDDGRWIAEVIGLPGAMRYGQTRADAISKAAALALRVLAERIEAGEEPLELTEIRFAAARVLGCAPIPLEGEASQDWPTTRLRPTRKP